ncbi:MAG: hypothetical protein Ta2D_12460 [Rickettsiales bacterium]|nr:MAG: hypothetical protein Ta2D_12460 [Rickettsiales bacterium]
MWNSNRMWYTVDKAETSLVECYNSSLRGRFSKFVRKTKAYSKSFDNLYNSVYMWINQKTKEKEVRNIVGGYWGG